MQNSKQYTLRCIFCFLFTQIFINQTNFLFEKNSVSQFLLKAHTIFRLNSRKEPNATNGSLMQRDNPASSWPLNSSVFLRLMLFDCCRSILYHIFPSGVISVSICFKNWIKDTMTSILYVLTKVWLLSSTFHHLCNSTHLLINVSLNHRKCSHYGLHFLSSWYQVKFHFLNHLFCLAFFKFVEVIELSNHR